MTSVATALSRYLPSGNFTRAMEELIEKENPDNTVGWPASPVPDWATGFRPRVIADLGTGLGGETIAVLTRLALWGCLGDLRSIHLFEHDGTLDADGKQGIKRFLEHRIRSGPLAALLGDVDVQAHTDSLSVELHAGRLCLEPLEGLGIKPDFVLASHITYFFDDGSGERLARAILDSQLSADGLLWMNIRNLHCPAYEGRAAAMALLGIEDPQPFDYAEQFVARVLPALQMARPVDVATVAPRLRAGADRQTAAELIMWRSTLDASTACPEVLRSAITVCAQGELPLFAETQFVIALSRHKPTDL